MNNRLNNNRGSLLIMTYYVISSMIIIGAAFVVLMVNDQRTSMRHQINIQAQAIAEAGLERALQYLKLDYQDSHNLRDGTINGVNLIPDDNNFVALFTDEPFGQGKYTVSIKTIIGSTREAWVKAEGTVRDNTQIIQAYVKMVDASTWSNAVTIGAGSAGKAINGPLNIRGSIHLLASTLSSSDTAMTLTGSSSVLNNVDGLVGDYVAKMVSNPQTSYNNETVSTLYAQLRVKHGLVHLSDSSSIGQSNVTLNNIKETLDGVYTADGFSGGNAAAIYADNGSSTTYDISSSTFVSLSDPYQTSPSFQIYFYSNALVIDDAGELAQLANLLPTTVFNKTSANGSLITDGNGNLTVSGKVYVNGPINFNKAGGQTTFTYSGKGTILATGDVGINANLLTAGNASFPSNALGIQTPGNMTINEPNIEIMGLLYAEGSITISQQAIIIGSLATNYLDTQSSNPTIVHVPAISASLPSGIIGSQQQWIPVIVSWQKL